MPSVVAACSDGLELAAPLCSQGYAMAWTQNLTPAERTEFTPVLEQCEFGKVVLDWCDLLNASRIPGFSLSFFLLRKGRLPLGVGVFYMMRRFDATRYLVSPWRSRFERLGRLGLNPFRFDVGFLDVPFVRGSGLLVPSWVSADEQVFLTRELLQAIENRFRPHVILASLAANEDIRGQLAKDKELARVSFAPNAELELPFASFEGYLASLGKKARWDVKDKIRRFDRAGGRIELTSDSRLYADEFYKLWQNTRGAREGTDPVWPVEANVEVFRNLGRLGAENCSILVARVSNKTAGFLVLVVSGKTLYYKFCGLDYELSLPTMAYFNLLYSGIKVALDLRCVKISFGPTTYFNKERLGGKLVPYDWYVDVVRGVLRIGRKLIPLH